VIAQREDDLRAERRVRIVAPGFGGDVLEHAHLAVTERAPREALAGFVGGGLADQVQCRLRRRRRDERVDLVVVEVDAVQREPEHVPGRLDCAVGDCLARSCAHQLPSRPVEGFDPLLALVAVGHVLKL
jgi:hypothetical protein